MAGATSKDSCDMAVGNLVIKAIMGSGELYGGKQERCITWLILVGSGSRAGVNWSGLDSQQLVSVGFECRVQP